MTLPLTARSSDMRTGAIILDSIRHVRDVLDASVSPDSNQVAATVVSSTAEGGQTHIWLTGRAATEPRQLTFSTDAVGKGESDPAWAPDGKTLFYLSTSNGKAGVSRVLLANGSTRQLQLRESHPGHVVAQWGNPIHTDDDLRPQRFSLSPDGRRIAITGTRKPTQLTAASSRKPLDDAFEPDRDENQQTSVYIVDLASMQVGTTALDGDAQSLAWSPDSAELIVVTGTETDVAGYRGEAWRIVMTGDAAQRIAGVSDTILSAAWSRDGLAYLARCEDEAPAECLQLFAWNRRNKNSRALTRGLHGDLVDNLVVDRDGLHVLVPVMLGLAQRVARVGLADGHLEWVDLAQPVALRLASNAARSAWVVLATGPTTPKSILLARALDSRFVSLPLPALVPAQWPTTKPRHLRWSNGGLSLEGLLYLPQQAHGPAPLIVWVHGGPYGAFQNRYYRLVNVLVAQGWAVLISNPRGSMGYGAAFASANRNDLGDADYTDVMAGVDLALARFPLDRDRMAMIGYSYGGTMTAFAEGRTDRFKALIAGAPVINQFSEYGTEDSSFDDRWYFGKPWEHPADAWRQSPLARVTKAVTPLLLLQGQADQVDPRSQSEEMYRAMVQVGVPVTLVVYPRETHASLAQAFGMGSSREPFHGVDLAQRMIAFLSWSFRGP